MRADCKWIVVCACRVIAAAVAATWALTLFGQAGPFNQPLNGWGAAPRLPAGPVLVDGTKLQVRLGATDEEWVVIWVKLRRVMRLRQELEQSLAPVPSGFGGFGFNFNMPGFGNALDAPPTGSMWGQNPPPPAPGAPATTPATAAAPAAPGLFGGQGLAAMLEELRTLTNDSNSSEAQLREKLEMIRAGRKRTRFELAEAENDLRALLSEQQEASLVSLGYME